MSRIKAQNAYWRNENVVLQIDLINMYSGSFFQDTRKHCMGK